MNKVLDTAKELLAKMQENPELAQKLSKAYEAAKVKKEELDKNNAPHKSGSPEDKAHDIVEEHEKLKHAITNLSPEGKAKMLAHLRTLHSQENLRSKANEEVGKAEIKEKVVDGEQTDAKEVDPEKSEAYTREKPMLAADKAQNRFEPKTDAGRRVMEKIKKGWSEDVQKADHQPHPGPSKSAHQKVFDAKNQSKEESKLKTPEGDKARQDENKARIASMKKDDKGVHAQAPGHIRGVSVMGAAVRNKNLKPSTVRAEAKFVTKQSAKMPKPNLPKSELEKAAPSKKDIKGVHKPHFGANYESGTSEVGAHMAPGGASKETNSWAKEQHKEKLSELRGMKKPNLPKSEKGVHTPSAVAGVSPVDRGASVTRFHGNAKKDTHKQVIKDIKAMPKPNLPKSEKK
jgi:hypothetical protein